MLHIFFEIIYKFLNIFHMLKIFLFLGSKLHNCNVIIDAGSHKGQMINLFKFIYSKSKIFGFEPQKKLFLDLLKKYSNNKNIQINNFALGNSNKKKKININFFTNSSTLLKINFKSHHYKIKSFILGKNAGFHKKETVKIVKLDDFCKRKKIQYIDLLKLDIEGSELDALYGFKKYIKKTKTIIIEINKNDYFKKNNSTKVIKFLKSNSFVVKKVIKFPVINFYDYIFFNKTLL